VTLLAGCDTVGELAAAPKHVGAELRQWVSDLGLKL
jgi:hypothetical protein